MSLNNQLKSKTKLQECYWKFWEGFNHFTKSDKAFCEEFKVHPFPSIRSYQDYHIGMPFHIVVGINFKLKEICIGAYLRIIRHGQRNVKKVWNLILIKN